MSHVLKGFLYTVAALYVMDYVKELAELKDKFNLSLSDVDVRKVEQYQREVKNELSMKRNQVFQLKTELDVANSKIFELTKQLEATKSTLKETDFNLQLGMKKCSALETKINEMNNTYMKMKLKEELRTSEIKVLNENAQTLARDKHQLSREISELNDKLKFYYTFQNEMNDKQMQINMTMAKIKDDSEKLETEHRKVQEFVKQLRYSEEIRNMCSCLTKENQKLKKENTEMENCLVQISAKNEILTSLIRNHKHVNIYKENLITKIKFLQWENRCKDLQKQSAADEQLIKSLTDALNKEIETSAKLHMKNEENEAYIEKLQSKISAIKSDLTIKQEVEEVNTVIEIE